MMESSLRSYSLEAFEYTVMLRRTDVEMWKKYAQALACFILFFIGAPLGALIKKGGLGTPAIVSVLFFVLYWVVDISGTKLARDGATSAWMGNFISAFVLAPIGAFLTWTAIQDSSLFNTDGFKTGWRRVKSKIMSLFRKTRIVYMGTPEFSVAPLDALIKSGYKIVGVVTAVDKPSGRGLKLSESAVKKYAVEKGLPILQPEKLKDPAFLEALAAWKADLFVVVGFRMLPEQVWAMPKMGTFNLHAALLPQYRGAAPINWAVINGENITGVTTFMIDKNMDTGGIILRQDCRIGKTDTVGDVHDRLMELGSQLVLDTVEGLIEGNVETRVQRSFIQGSELLHPAPKLTRELQQIDWNDSTRRIYNLIRGLSPFPCAFTFLEKDGESTQLKIYFGEERSDLHAAPGTVLSDGKTYLAIATADGAIALKDIQLAGKKRMDIQSFLLGFRDPCSYKAAAGTSKAEIEKAKPLES
jgi:methionyl-tRNA formyltransferase